MHHNSNTYCIVVISDFLIQLQKSLLQTPWRWRSSTDTWGSKYGVYYCVCYVCLCWLYKWGVFL